MSFQQLQESHVYKRLIEAIDGFTDLLVTSWDILYQIDTSWWFQPIWKILVELNHFPK